MSKNNDEKSQLNLSTEGDVRYEQTTFSDFKKARKSKSKKEPQKPSDKKAENKPQR